MSKFFNPSNRKSYELPRFCSHCKTSFKCDASCGNNQVIEDQSFCFCPQCWIQNFGDRHIRDEHRGKCVVLEKYLKALGREKDFSELGDDC